MSNQNFFALLLSVLFILPVAVLAQQIQTEIEFSQYQEEYTPLVNATSLTSTSGAWGLGNWETHLDSSFTFPGMEDRPFQRFGASTIGQVALWHFLSEDDLEFDLYMIPFNVNVVSPLQDFQNADQGAILRKIEGNDKLWVEFRNVALAVEKIIGNGRLVSRLNFTVEIDPENERVRFHYGPSNVTTSTQNYFLDSGIMLGLGFEVWENKGSASQPDYERLENSWVHLKGTEDDFEILEYTELDPPQPESSFLTFPSEGTVYEFQFSSMPTSVLENWTDNSVNIFPNPGNDEIQIQVDDDEENIQSISVFNLSGKRILNQENLQNMVINASEWPSGLYFIQLNTNTGSSYFKWVKK